LKGREGRGERGKTSFLVKRSFPAFPASSPHIGNKAYEKRRCGYCKKQFFNTRAKVSV